MAKQSEIFARYRSLVNSNSKAPGESVNSRRLNNLDFVDFLFELLRTTKGEKQFKNIVLKGSLNQLKNSDKIDKLIKSEFLKLFGCDTNLLIPDKYTTKSSLGIEITKNEIDTFGLLAVDPNGVPGKYLYEGNDINKDINFMLYKAQNTTTESPISAYHKNNILFQIYAKNNNMFDFKFGEFYANKEFSLWLNDYFDFMGKIFNVVNFTALLTDIISGTMSIKGQKNKTEMQSNIQIIQGLQKLFGFCSDTNDNNNNLNQSANNSLNNLNNNNNNLNNNGINTNEDSNDDLLNNIFNLNDFTPSELEEINTLVDLRFNGKIRFATCGDLDINTNPDNILSDFEKMLLYANNSNIYSYDDNINNGLSNINNNEITDQDGNLIYDNTQIDINTETSSDFLDNIIQDGAIDIIQSGETNVILDLPNMRLEMQLNILKAIPYVLSQMILTPRLLLIPKLHKVLNNDNSKKTNEEMVQSVSKIIIAIGASIITLLLKNLYETIISDVTKLSKTIIQDFLLQRGMDYINTLRSLIPNFNLSELNGCVNILDLLYQLLSLGQLGPMPQLPPPLILVGGALKPGLNSISMVNEVKSNLIEKGIDTSATLPDGTPNNLMIAVEEVVKVMTNNIKTKSTIQTFGIGATGPVTGYGQIQ